MHKNKNSSSDFVNHSSHPAIPVISSRLCRYDVLLCCSRNTELLMMLMLLARTLLLSDLLHVLIPQHSAVNHCSVTTNLLPSASLLHAGPGAVYSLLSLALREAVSLVLVIRDVTFGLGVGLGVCRLDRGG